MTDLIKREEVWAKITQYVSTHQTILLPHIQKLINDIPSVEQDRPTGHWKKEVDFGNCLHYICSECGEEGYDTNFCANCGAKME